MAILEVKTIIETKQAEKNVDDLSGKMFPTLFETN